MRLTIILAAILVVVCWGAYELYQDPRVQEIFREPAPQSLSNPPPPVEIPHLPEKPEPEKKPAEVWAGTVGTTNETKPNRTDLPPAEEEQKEPPAAKNQVANDVVSRVLLQVLAARKLVYSVSIGVTDKVVTVTGVVDSEEKRDQILDIINKARETRRVDATNLVVSK